jgi:hypothetical protein
LAIVLALNFLSLVVMKERINLGGAHQKAESTTMKLV